MEEQIIDETALWDDFTDIGIFAEFGTPATDWEELTDVELRLAQDITVDEEKALRMIKAAPKSSLAEVAKGLSKTTKEASEILAKLINKKVLNPAPASGGGMTITPTGQNILDTREPGSVLITTKYRYTGPRDEKVRPFCDRMMALNRVYDREEIDTISQRLGYDVWKRRGGWYRVPGSDPPTNIPHCRHSWQGIILRRRTA
jgi:hypothetical protein